MSDTSPHAVLDARLESAAEAMERADWTGAVGLLVGILADVHGHGLDAVEATVRALLAQALASTGDMDTALEQAGHAMVAAERSDNRDVIHRCMALLASLRILVSDAR